MAFPVFLCVIRNSCTLVLLPCVSPCLPGPSQRPHVQAQCPHDPGPRKALQGGFAAVPCPAVKLLLTQTFFAQLFQLPTLSSLNSYTCLKNWNGPLLISMSHVHYHGCWRTLQATPAPLPYVGSPQLPASLAPGMTLRCRLHYVLALLKALQRVI